MHRLPAIFGFLLAMLTHGKAHAQVMNGANAVSAGLGLFAAGTFRDIGIAIGNSFLLFVNGAAVLSMVIAGILAVVAQDENRIQSARKVVVMALVAIVLINISVAVVNAYIIGFNFDEGADAVAAGNILSLEIFGFINFIETPVIVIAILTIIIYGLKALIDYSGERGIGQFKQAIIAILFGIFIIVTKYILATAVTTGNPIGIIDPTVRLLFTIVSFVALAAVVVIVIAGIYMVANIGNDERFQRAKGMIALVVLGIFVMLIVSGLLAIVIDGIGSAPDVPATTPTS